LDRDYIAFLGGVETYGKFIETPFPALVEKRLAMPCVNFGVQNAGVDLYLNDHTLMDLVAQAQAKVVQVTGSHCMSNRYYSVHPRRNDRFLRASDRLIELYPEVDFTEFHFVRHMLGRLHDLSADRFRQITEELGQAWVARMKSLLAQIQGNVVLLWFADAPIPKGPSADLEHDPLFLSRDMVEALRNRVTTIIELVASESALMEGTKGMVFSEFEANAAAEMMGPYAHNEAADALEEVLGHMLGRIGR
jgi:hypothetical protein